MESENKLPFPAATAAAPGLSSRCVVSCQTGLFLFKTNPIAIVVEQTAGGKLASRRATTFARNASEHPAGPSSPQQPPSPAVGLHCLLSEPRRKRKKKHKQLFQRVLFDGDVFKAGANTTRRRHCY